MNNDLPPELQRGVRFYRNDREAMFGRMIDSLNADVEMFSTNIRPFRRITCAAVMNRALRLWERTWYLHEVGFRRSLTEYIYRWILGKGVPWNFVTSWGRADQISVFIEDWFKRGG